MKQYEKYKDSGVKWLGEIPEHWDERKLKWIFFEKIKVTNPELNCGAISFGEVVYKDDEKIPEATKNSYQVVNKGEFLLNPLNLNYDLKSLRIALSKIDVVVSSGYIVLKNRIKIEKEYFRWLLHIYDIKYMKTLGAGVRQTINFKDISESLLPLPTIEEQTAIANFLDDKTAKIDQAIAIKEKEINLLKERRQILIQKTVTKGLNPNAKLKHSGVEWIGEIPEHWDFIRLRMLSKIYSGGTPDKTNLKFWDNGTIPWIASGEVNQEFIKVPTTYISENGFKCSSAKWIRKKSLVVALAGQGKTKGMVAYLDIDTTGNQSLAAVIPNINYVLPLYLFYFIKSAYKELRGTAGEGERDGLNLSKLGNLFVSFPKISEQKEICIFLKTNDEKITKAISLKQQEIEKLKEYKTVLVDNVVTGKVRVS